MAKLWVFGGSMCLPYNIDSAGWPTMLAHRLGMDLENLAELSIDNLYIYYSVMRSLELMQPDDRAVIGWTHPSRKTWIYDPDNPWHGQIGTQSWNWQNYDQKFFRFGRALDSNTPGRFKKGQKSGVDFFDHWFEVYFNRAEEDAHLQAFVDSTRLRLPGHVSFYMSKESISNIRTTDPDPLYYLDFVQANKLQISKEDLHMNEQGHAQWTEIIYHRLQGETHVIQP